MEPIFAAFSTDPTFHGSDTHFRVGFSTAFSVATIIRVFSVAMMEQFCTDSGMGIRTLL